MKLVRDSVNEVHWTLLDDNGDVIMYDVILGVFIYPTEYSDYTSVRFVFNEIGDAF